ncbi:hypothetical protein CCR75_007756 [Bremia lactucae]|uniref:Sphingomyelin phosphodiesterase n=1 Tax=Bremia lactucae TaxID=4779 RepID=A0A976FFC9_BRELC|nr:hypothetical protein CCR75_007756 [Bremia lactucae]
MLRAGDSAASSASNSSALTFSDSDAEFDRALKSYDVPAVTKALHQYLVAETQASISAGLTAKRQPAQLRSVFYVRFNQILDRIFGLDLNSKQKSGGLLDYSIGVGMLTTPGSVAILSVKRRAEQRRDRAMAGVATNEGEIDEHLINLTVSGRAIVKLLGGGVRSEDGSLFQFLFRLHHPVEFKLALDLLPEKSKMTIVSGQGVNLLFTQLMHKPLAKQRLDLRNPELLVTITELYMFYFLRHPTGSSHQTQLSTSITVEPLKSSPESFNSSILSSAAKLPQSSWRKYEKDGIVALTKGSPYNVLLLQYLRAFLPDSNYGTRSRFHGRLLKESNLFLHILIEFWLQQNLVTFSDESLEASTPARCAIRPPLAGSMHIVSPFASVFTSTSYVAPSDDLLSSLSLTIIHLLADSFFPAALTEDSASGSHGNAGVYLSRSVTMLRPPLYAFFRLVFSRAPIGLSSTAFLAIADVWLAFIQPWCCRSWIDSKDQLVGDTTAEQNTVFEYTSAWESYVLANYHFYTVLLGVFVKRANEFDFSTGDKRNLQTVVRVMKVFNTDLLAILRRASLYLEKSQQLAMLSNYQRGANKTLMVSDSLSSSSKRKSTLMGDAFTTSQVHVLTFYCKSLGIDCTPVPLHGSFHRDAERLFDKLWAAVATSNSDASASTTIIYQNVSAVFRTSHKKSVNMMAEQAEHLSRRLRVIFEISDAYVASTAHSRSSISTKGDMKSFAPGREKFSPHLLTREGIFQLQHGMRLCSSDTANYVGDPMLSPICSYEVVWLVRLSYRVSTWLNAHFGFVNPYQGKHIESNLAVNSARSFSCFRFDFRFLASKINLSFLSAVVLLLYALYIR